MKAQHTPGEWIAEIGTHRVAVRSLTSHVVSEDLSANDQWAIATVHGPDHESNARLIAAAPELLKALRFAMGFLEAEFREWPRHGTKAALDLVAAAVAKAEGKQ